MSKYPLCLLKVVKYFDGFFLDYAVFLVVLKRNYRSLWNKLLLLKTIV